MLIKNNRRRIEIHDLYKMDSLEKSNLEEKLADRDALSVSMESSVTFVNLFTAIGGNLLVCWTIFKHSRLRSTLNMFIAWLAISDVLIAALGFPFTLAVLLTGHWPFNKAACNFQGFTFTLFGTFSLFTMTLTAIARYFKVTRPSTHRKIYTKRNISLFVALAFFISMIFPIVVTLDDAFSFHPGKFICIYDCDKLSSPACLTMGIFLVVTCYGPIVLFCHICIFRSVRQHNIQVANSTEERVQRANIQVDEMRVTKLLLAIVIAFTCCWSPLFIIDGIGMFTGKYWMPREVYMTYTYLSGYSSSVNPVIYGIFNHQLRRELCKVIVCVRKKRAGVQPQG